MGPINAIKRVVKAIVEPLPLDPLKNMFKSRIKIIVLKYRSVYTRKMNQAEKETTLNLEKENLTRTHFSFKNRQHNYST